MIFLLVVTIVLILIGKANPVLGFIALSLAVPLLYAPVLIVELFL